MELFGRKPEEIQRRAPKRPAGSPQPNDLTCLVPPNTLQSSFSTSSSSLIAMPPQQVQVQTPSTSTLSQALTSPIGTRYGSANKSIGGLGGGGPMRNMSSLRAHRSNLYTRPSCLDLSRNGGPFSMNRYNNDVIPGRRPILLSSRKIKDEHDDDPQLTSTAQRIIKVLQKNSPAVVDRNKIAIDSTFKSARYELGKLTREHPDDEEFPLPSRVGSKGPPKLSSPSFLATPRNNIAPPVRLPGATFGHDMPAASERSRRPRRDSDTKESSKNGPSTIQIEDSDDSDDGEFEFRDAWSWDQISSGVRQTKDFNGNIEDTKRRQSVPSKQDFIDGSKDKTSEANKISVFARRKSIEKNEPLSAASFRPAQSWQCPTCCINNDDSVVKCIACTEPKPGLPLQQSTPKEEPVMGPWSTPKRSRVESETKETPKNVTSVADIKESGSSNQPQCQFGIKNAQEPIINKAKRAKDNDDNEEARAIKIPPSKPDLTDGTKDKAGDANKMPVFTPPKPVEKSAPLSAASFRPAKSWQCPTCCINNDDSVVKCIACSEPKPGLPPPVTASQVPKVMTTMNTPTTTFSPSSLNSQGFNLASNFSFGSASKPSVSAVTTSASPSIFGGSQQSVGIGKQQQEQQAAVFRAPEVTKSSASSPAPTLTLSSGFGTQQTVFGGQQQAPALGSQINTPPSTSGSSVTPMFGAPAAVPNTFRLPPGTSTTFGTSASMPTPAPAQNFGFPSPPATSFGGQQQEQQPSSLFNVNTTTPSSSSSQGFSLVPTFSFGDTSKPPIFGGTASTQPSIFGSSQQSVGFGMQEHQQQQQPSVFGAPQPQVTFAPSLPTPAPSLSTGFGGMQQQTPSVFGGQQQASVFGSQMNTPSTTFGPSVRSATPMFGSQAPTPNAFGLPAAASTPFGASMPTPTPAPTQNFGFPSSPVTPFGGQQQEQQSGSLFNMGTGTSPSAGPGGRVIRKAVRRMNR